MPPFLDSNPCSFPVITGAPELAPPKAFTVNYCPCKKRYSISVKRRNGEDYKYEFDESVDAFKPLRCIQCQSRVTEKDLRPYYSIYHPEIESFVTFVENLITDKLEQYVYNPKINCFEQVNLADLVFDQYRNRPADLLYTMDTEDGAVVIRKDKKGFFAVENFRKDLQAFSEIVCSDVKTLPVEEATEEEPAEEIRTRFTVHYDPRGRQDVVFALRNRELMSVHAYDYSTGNFQRLDSSIAYPERFLFPKYVAYSNRIDNCVIHARNGMMGTMEQFIYCEKSRGFQQVLLPELVYDPSLDTKSDILLTIEGSEDVGTTVISKDGYDGSIKKHQFNMASLQFEELPPVEVKFLSAHRELEDKEDKASKKPLQVVAEHCTKNTLEHLYRRVGQMTRERKKLAREETDRVTQEMVSICARTIQKEFKKAFKAVGGKNFSDIKKIIDENLEETEPINSEIRDQAESSPLEPLQQEEEKTENAGEMWASRIDGVVELSNSSKSSGKSEKDTTAVKVNNSSAEDASKELSSDDELEEELGLNESKASFSTFLRNMLKPSRYSFDSDSSGDIDIIDSKKASTRVNSAAGRASKPLLENNGNNQRLDEEIDVDSDDSKISMTGFESDSDFDIEKDSEVKTSNEGFTKKMIYGAEDVDSDDSKISIDSDSDYDFEGVENDSNVKTSSEGNTVKPKFEEEPDVDSDDSKISMTGFESDSDSDFESMEKDSDLKTSTQGATKVPRFEEEPDVDSDDSKIRFDFESASEGSDFDFEKVKKDSGVKTSKHEATAEPGFKEQEPDVDSDDSKISLESGSDFDFEKVQKDSDMKTSGEGVTKKPRFEEEPDVDSDDSKITIESDSDSDFGFEKVEKDSETSNKKASAEKGKGEEPDVDSDNSEIEMDSESDNDLLMLIPKIVQKKN